MKQMLLAIGLFAAAGSAGAQDDPARDQSNTLAPVIVERADGARIVIECTPPAGDIRCAQLHRLIRENFSRDEIGMLFGAATAYPEYLTSYARVRERYDAFVRDIRENGIPVNATYYDNGRHDED